MPPPFDLQGHVALITGANHGIGAATALTLASCGAAVVVSYLRIQDPGDIGGPDVYRRNREMTADHVVTTVARQGGRAIAIEADLTDVGSPARLCERVTSGSMSPKAAKQKSNKTTTVTRNAVKGFTDQERATMREPLSFATTRDEPW
jgi:NAD(P)-dependent dehydrogenase (short-subunit alcohol dehydrogenase family)